MNVKFLSPRDQRLPKSRRLRKSGYACFLRAVQSVFLQKRHLETADLYDAPAIVGFGQDAVERWFTESEMKEIVKFTERLAI